MNCVRILASVAVCVLMGNSITKAADIRQGLVAYWQMNDTDGVTIPDATPFGNNLNVVGLTGANIVPGQFGNAVQLNGSSTYATNLHTPDPTLTGLPIYRAGSYTITMWVKGPAQTARYLYSEAFTNAPGSPPVAVPQNPIIIFQTGQAAANSNKFDVIIRDDAGGTRVNHVVSSATVFDDTWHHIAWVDDRGTVRLYIDGVLDTANFNYTPSGNFTLNTSTIGALTRAAVQGFFNGLIDDVGLWKRALTSNEVQNVRTNSLVIPIPSFPAVIVTHPVGSTNRVGDRVTFSATVDGNTPISFQWFKSGVTIPGATAISLTLSNLLVGDSADYTLRVSNSSGTNVSNPATLLVLPDPAPDVRKGIVSHWSMDDELDDGAGHGVLVDPYGHNDFKAVGPGGFIDLAPGVSVNGAVFNGLDQYCYRDGGFPSYNNLAYSIAFWVKATGAGQTDRRLFAESSTNNNSVFSFGTDAAGTNSAMRVLVRRGSGSAALDRNTARPVLDGAWHHVAWVETNGEARLYVDGTLDENSFNYSRTGIVFQTTTIGALLSPAGASNFFNGMLDEVAVWARPLSFTEVQQVRTNGIPAPLSDLPPTITANPANQSVLSRANVTFAFAASGTGPLFPQWRKGGANLPGQTNTILTLSNVTLADAGNYDVVVTNTQGRATSQVAVLAVTLRPAVSDLKVDVNNLGADDSPANTEPGFSSFTLDVAITPGPVTRTYGGAEVTISSLGGISLQSRRRLLPTNTLEFTEEKLLQDFIFSPDTVVGQGLNVAIDYLEPNQTYTLTIWSFDNANNGRMADWSANGATLVNAYSFTGSNNPTNNTTSRFTFPVTADSNGRILIQGRRSDFATVANNVFLNAFRVTAPPAIRVEGIRLTATNTLHLNISGINGAVAHRIEQKTNVTDAVWFDVPQAIFTTPVGNTVEAIVPVPGTPTRFYRVVEGP